MNSLLKMTKSNLNLISFSDGTSFLVSSLHQSKNIIQANIDNKSSNYSSPKSMIFNQTTKELWLTKENGDSFMIPECTLLGITEVNDNPFR